MSNDYSEVYSRSLEDPEGFWAEAAESIHWEKRWDTVLDASNPPFYRWFRGGMLNTCYNALGENSTRYHAENRGQQGRQTIVSCRPPASS